MTRKRADNRTARLLTVVLLYNRALVFFARDPRETVVCFVLSRKGYGELVALGSHTVRGNVFLYLRNGNIYKMKMFN